MFMYGIRGISGTKIHVVNHSKVMSYKSYNGPQVSASRVHVQAWILLVSTTTEMQAKESVLIESPHHITSHHITSHHITSHHILISHDLVVVLH